MAAEEDDEEQEEDVLVRKRGKAVGEGVWTVARAGDGAIGPGDQPERSGERPSDLTALQRDNGAANRHSVITEKREAGDKSGGRTAGETAAEKARADRELWKDGPVWTVRSVEPDINKAQRAAATERTVQAEEALQSARDGDLAWAGLEWAARGGALGPVLDGAGRSGTVQAGLKGLYRQTVQGLRPAAPALPPEQAGRTARAQEPGSAASLAVEELDRAVRRDSRRYDGGMSIY